MRDAPQNLADRLQVLKKQSWRPLINTTNSPHIHISTKQSKSLEVVCVSFLLLFICLLACFFHAMEWSFLKFHRLFVIVLHVLWPSYTIDSSNRIKTTGLWKKNVLNSSHVVEISIVRFLNAFLRRTNRMLSLTHVWPCSIVVTVTATSQYDKCSLSYAILKHKALKNMTGLSSHCNYNQKEKPITFFCILPWELCSSLCMWLSMCMCLYTEVEKIRKELWKESERWRKVICFFLLES